MIERHPDAARAAGALAAEVASILASALEDRGRATLVAPGGRTPVPFFERLRGTRLDWSRISVTPGDERWVDPASSGSNEHLLRASLLRDAAAAATFVPLKNSAPTPADGAAAAWQALAQLPRPFDVVMLGMGEDGHFASLFPGQPGLDAALDARGAPACVAMQAPVEPRPRLSLNLAALLDARRLILQVTGGAKLALLEAVLAGAGEAGAAGEASSASGASGALPRIPVSALLRQDRRRVEIHWAP